MHVQALTLSNRFWLNAQIFLTRNMSYKGTDMHTYFPRSMPRKSQNIFENFHSMIRSEAFVNHTFDQIYAYVVSLFYIN